jgi:8-oxo-dGTP pyrophosphatase MutT (NUDIX family)
MTKAYITGENVLCSGRFIALHRLNYIDDRNIERTWESAVRVNSTPAVMVLPVIKPDNEIVLIRQFRPPTGRYMWETPAGLIDPGEDVATAALRELAEETGFSGTVTRLLPASYSTAGLSGESVYMAFVEIDGSEFPPERKLETHFDESENITTYRVKLADLADFLLKKIEQGDGVDSKLLLYSQIITAP